MVLIIYISSTFFIEIAIIMFIASIEFNAEGKNQERRASKP